MKKLFKQFAVVYKSWVYVAKELKDFLYFVYLKALTSLAGKGSKKSTNNGGLHKLSNTQSNATPSATNLQTKQNQAQSLGNINVNTSTANTNNSLPTKNLDITQVNFSNNANNNNNINVKNTYKTIDSKQPTPKVIHTNVAQDSEPENIEAQDSNTQTTEIQNTTTQNTANLSKPNNASSNVTTVFDTINNVKVSAYTPNNSPSQQININTQQVAETAFKENEVTEAEFTKNTSTNNQYHNNINANANTNPNTNANVNYTSINNANTIPNSASATPQGVSAKDILLPPNLAKPKKRNRLFLYAFRLFYLGLIAVALLITYIAWDAPDYNSIINYQPPLSTRLYAADGALITEFSNEKRLFVPVYDIPKHVQEAFISAEDKNFYSHHGFDFKGYARAMVNNVKYLLGRYDNFQGASTISQQVSKNFFLDSSRTIMRKLKEAYITFRIENLLSKDYILELYLNQIYLGRGSYGVATASLNYFNKSVSQLTLEEAAFLAALPKAPSRYDPANNYTNAKDRRDWVISRMLDDGKITQQQANTATNAPINFVENNVLQPYNDINKYASEEIRKDLVAKFGNNKFYNDGLIIKSTINNAYQQYAYKSLRNGLETFDKRLGYRKPFYSYNEEYTTAELLSVTNNTPLWLNLMQQNKQVSTYKFKIDPWRLAMVLSVDKQVVSIGLLTGDIVEVYLENNNWVKPADTNQDADFSLIFKPSDVIYVEEVNGVWEIKQVPEVNGAIMVMNIHTGDVLAMQGGYSFVFSQFNRATQAYRQPGSGFKPFVYLSALTKGASPADTVLDAPYIYDNGDTVWRPKNDNNSYRGYVTLRLALERSVNLATIRVTEAIGLDAISNITSKLGLYNEPLDNFSQALGSKETTLQRIITAYSIIANGGKKITPNLVQLVQDKNGNTLYSSANIDCVNCNAVQWQNQQPTELPDNRQQLLDPQNAYLIKNLMKGVVDRGTGRALRMDKYDIAGKTGTTNEVKDTWFTAFTADIAVSVYFGYDTPRSLGNHSSSVSIAVPIVKNFFMQILQNYKPQPFRTPNGIEMRWVDYTTGEPSFSGAKGAILEAFKVGEPTKTNVLSNVKEENENSSSVDVIY